MRRNNYELTGERIWVRKTRGNNYELTGERIWARKEGVARVAGVVTGTRRISERGSVGRGKQPESRIIRKTVSLTYVLDIPKRSKHHSATKGQPAKTIEFKAVYDARKTLRDKSLLQQLNVGQLKLRDFVVLEVQVGRYATRDEGVSDAKGKKRNMDRWQSFYDLQAVYKFKDAVQADDTAPAVADFEI
ncbi:hypothetical protein C8R47DRAFT_1076095 [Mycena vitilis]|nr:hypothetical protein C8R47DRAFT_1076095 [Mycena vitilis]